MPEFEEALAMAIHDEKQSRKGMEHPPLWSDRWEESKRIYRMWASLVKPALARMGLQIVEKPLVIVSSASEADRDILPPGKVEQWPG